MNNKDIWQKLRSAEAKAWRVGMTLAGIIAILFAVGCGDNDVTPTPRPTLDPNVAMATQVHNQELNQQLAQQLGMVQEPICPTDNVVRTPPVIEGSNKIEFDLRLENVSSDIYNGMNVIVVVTQMGAENPSADTVEQALDNVKIIITDKDGGDIPVRTEPCNGVIMTQMNNYEGVDSVRGVKVTYPGATTTFDGYDSNWSDGTIATTMSVSPWEDVKKVFQESLTYDVWKVGE